MRSHAGSGSGRTGSSRKFFCAVRVWAHEAGWAVESGTGIDGFGALPGRVTWALVPLRCRAASTGAHWLRMSTAGGVPRSGGATARRGARVPECRWPPRQEPRHRPRRRAPGTRPERQPQRPAARRRPAGSAERQASWARMSGQAGSRSVRYMSRQRKQAVRPGSTSGPTMPIASLADAIRCGIRSFIRAADSSGSDCPISTVRSGRAGRRGGPAVALRPGGGGVRAAAAAAAGVCSGRDGSGSWSSPPDTSPTPAVARMVAIAAAILPVPRI